jgi:hypothetical protein
VASANESLRFSAALHSLKTAGKTTSAWSSDAMPEILRLVGEGLLENLYFFELASDSRHAMMAGHDKGFDRSSVSLDVFKRSICRGDLYFPQP